MPYEMSRDFAVSFHVMISVSVPPPLFLHFQFVNSSRARITYGIVQFNVPLLKGMELAPNPNYSGGSYI